MAIDIAQKMRELIPLLHEGINGVALPGVESKRESEWSADYAIIGNVYHDNDDYYFDESAFRGDVRALLKSHFSEDGVSTLVYRRVPGEKFQPGTIVVRFDEFRLSGEIEVYRVREVAQS